MTATCACSQETRPIVSDSDHENTSGIDDQPSLIDWKTIWKPMSAIVVAFLAFFWLPLDSGRFQQAVISSLALAKWYAQEHVLLCLVPAFFIAGAISCFVSQAAVMKYLGAGAHKVLAYGVASVSGTILAVCSCTVLPLFRGHLEARRGARAGHRVPCTPDRPSTSWPSSDRPDPGHRDRHRPAVGAILFSVVIGLIMHLIYHKEEQAKAEAALHMPEQEVERPLWQNVVYFAAMVGHS
jgi:uncharacterized protein